MIYDINMMILDNILPPITNPPYVQYRCIMRRLVSVPVWDGGTRPMGIPLAAVLHCTVLYCVLHSASSSTHPRLSHHWPAPGLQTLPWSPPPPPYSSSPPSSSASSASPRYIADMQAVFDDVRMENAIVGEGASSH